MNHIRIKNGGKPRNILRVFLVILILAAAVTVGLLLPGMICAVQSGSIDRYNRQADLGTGALSLTSDDAKLEKLRLINDAQRYERMGSPMETVNISDGQFMTAGDAMEALDQVAELISGTGLPCCEFSAADVQFVEPKLMVSDVSGMTTAIVWSVGLYSSDGENYQNLYYLVDDSTGIILAVKHDQSGGGFAAGIEQQRQALTGIAENMSECYCFSDTEINAPDIDSDGAGYESSYYISFIRDGEILLKVPVTITMDSWSINYGS